MKRFLTFVAAVLAVLAVGQLPAAATTYPLNGARSVSGGAEHTCARMANGRVRCWGLNTDDQLGGGAVGNSSRAVLVQNPEGTGPLTGVIQLSTSAAGACALLSSREVVCWGDNEYGQRGIGNTAAQGPEPDYVVNAQGTGHLTGVRSIAPTRGRFNCAVLQNGQARCWGRNAEGQLGTGTPSATEPFPVAVRKVSGPGPLTGIADMSLGAGHACARLVNGQVRCWGYNFYGAVGDGTTTNRFRPVAVRKPSGTGPLAAVASLAVGDLHSCAVLRSGQARCWGSGSAGQLGIGFVNQRHRPVRVKGPGGTGLLTDVAALTAGGERTCARLRSGQARCWGDDDLGGLGNGLLGEVAYPGTVLDVAGTGPLTGVRSISAGDSHTCAVVGPGGALRCWGKGTTGQRGDDSTEPGAQLPVVVVRS